MKKDHILKTFFYIIYLIALTEIILRVPIVYERIFSNYEVRFPPIKVFLSKSQPDKEVLYFFFDKDSKVEFNYPIYKFFRKKINKIDININSYGFRGKKITENKSANTKRIIFLGDSFTFGWGLSDEETYPEKICKQLSQITNDLKFECVNLAMPGNNIFNSYQIFLNIALKFNPDIVIFGQNINDVESTLIQFDDTKNQLFINNRIADLFDGAPYNLGYEDNILGFSYLYRLFDFLIFAYKAKKEAIKYYNEIYTEKNLYYLNQNINSLIELKNACEIRKINFLVLLFPIFYKLGDNYPFKNIHNFFHYIYFQNNIAYIDFYDYFKDMDDYKLWIHPKDKHPNNIATSLISNKTVDFLLRNNYLNIRRIK